MIPLPRFLFALCALVALAGAAAPPSRAAAPPLPADSVYQLDAALTDQDDHALRFAEGRGEARLVSMFYTSCQFMCPLIIDTIRKTEHALPEAERKRLKVLMVSFDAAHDDPAALKALAGKRHIDTPRWTLAHANAADVRRIAAVLDIQYRALQEGGFSHSSVLILLDAEGRIVARSEKLGAADPQFVAAVERQLKGG